MRFNRKLQRQSHFESFADHEAPNFSSQNCNRVEKAPAGRRGMITAIAPREGD
jgi:hypothetical protein